MLQFNPKPKSTANFTLIRQDKDCLRADFKSEVWSQTNYRNTLSICINYPQFVYAAYTLGLFHVRGGEGGGEANQRHTCVGLLYFRQS